MTLEELSKELSSIKEGQAQLAEQLETLFRLVGNRVNRHEEEADQRFRRNQYAFTENQPAHCGAGI